MDPEIQTWARLNKTLRSSTEDDCEILLNKELRNACRGRFLLRIHGRLNKLRAQRERREILQKAKR